MHQCRLTFQAGEQVLQLAGILAGHAFGASHGNIVKLHAQRAGELCLIPICFAGGTQTDDVLDAGTGEHLHLFLRGLTAGKDIFLRGAEIENLRTLNGGGVDLGLSQS